MAEAWAQTFSVQLRSLVPTRACVSTIWWVNCSSAAMSGPMDAAMTGP